MPKHPACAAAISSSGLGPLPSPKRALKLYGVSLSVALCVVRLPEPSLPEPSHTADARRLMLAIQCPPDCPMPQIGEGMGAGRRRHSKPSQQNCRVEPGRPPCEPGPRTLFDHVVDFD